MILIKEIGGRGRGVRVRARAFPLVLMPSILLLTYACFMCLTWFAKYMLICPKLEYCPKIF